MESAIFSSSDFSQIPFLVLVGGKASRLNEISSSTPKCLLPVAGKPFLFHLLKQIQSGQGKNVILLTGHLHEVIEDKIKDFSHLTFHFSHENSPLGTGGALLQALPLVHDDFFLLNGDSFFDIDLKHLKNIGPSLALKRLEDTQDYGTVEFDSLLKITHFEEKTKTSRSYINAGIYYLKKEYFSSFPLINCSLEKDLLPQIIKKHELKAFLSDNYFIDIGTPERLQKAQEDFLHDEFFR